MKAKKNRLHVVNLHLKNAQSNEEKFCSYFRVILKTQKPLMLEKNSMILLPRNTGALKIEGFHGIFLGFILNLTKGATAILIF